MKLNQLQAHKEECMNSTNMDSKYYSRYQVMCCGTRLVLAQLDLDAVTGLITSVLYSIKPQHNTNYTAVEIGKPGDDEPDASIDDKGTFHYSILKMFEKQQPVLKQRRPMNYRPNYSKTATEN